MRHRLAGCLVALTLLAPPALADALQVVGAGSLTEAFADMLRRFPAGADTIAVPESGPSGLMRQKIDAGLHFWPLRNQRFLCSRLRSRLLVERLGMQTRFTPFAFTAASFLAE
jgi:hypothetical protein